ncbi:alpha/beta fold hydrolase [Parafrankia sp. EUN1f]|uniref:alpha/beta fold hydrolase n=1 Tax=Parafrankia sp. EUN1f TaxID=102897 RepID=UPI0001C442C1|nr:alpha/beta fold hydrolase [Parafrankia sp. EUN1f]EFC84850.1 alpha/beta hydrolase fold protein [Parafrankia sp. EUN1f]
MRIVPANGIELAVETHGDPDGLPLLLVGGLGQHLVGWHPDLVASMVRRGYHVITFDNRDVGHSTHLDWHGPPDLLGIVSGQTALAPYGLEDMAADTIGLLDALGVESAHVFGVSLGGMVAQLLALNSPDRVRSLTSVMSHPGDHSVKPSDEAVELLLRPSPTSLDEFIARAEESARVIGSPEFAVDVPWLHSRSRQLWERRQNPAGVARQLAAILVAADRSAALRGLRVPTLVVHGTHDPLIPVRGGRLTAATVPSAELLEIDGMAHDLPREIWERLLDRVDDVTYHGESLRAAVQ